MKLKKIVAAVSAVTMLGSLAVAMPMSASAAEVSVSVNASAVKQINAVRNSITRTNTANGTFSIVPKAEGYTLTQSDFTNNWFDGDITTTTNVNLERSYYVDLGSAVDITKVVISNYDGATILGFTNTVPTEELVTADEWLRLNNSNTKKLNEYTAAYTAADAEGNDTGKNYVTLTRNTGATTAYRYLIIDSNGSTKALGEVALYTEVAGNPATAVDLTSDAEGKTLYYGDKVTFTPTLTPAGADDSVTYTFIGAQDETDWTNQFVVDPEDPNTFTYNTKERRGGTQGRITVTATAMNGGVSGTTEIKTQRFQNIKYQFANEAGVAVEISVVTKADGVQVDSRNITIAADADGTTANASADKRFSGNASTLTVEADVPTGYELTLENDGVYTVNGDAVIKGTLSKAVVPSTADIYDNDIQYFTGDNDTTDTAASFIADLTAGSTAITKLGVTVNDTDVRAMQSIGTVLDGEGAGILIKVIVTGVTASDTITLNID